MKIIYNELEVKMCPFSDYENNNDSTLFITNPLGEGIGFKKRFVDKTKKYKGDYTFGSYNKIYPDIEYYKGYIEYYRWTLLYIKNHPFGQLVKMDAEFPINFDQNEELINEMTEYCKIFSKDSFK